MVSCVIRPKKANFVSAQIQKGKNVVIMRTVWFVVGGEQGSADKTIHLYNISDKMYRMQRYIAIYIGESSCNAYTRGNSEKTT